MNLHLAVRPTILVLSAVALGMAAPAIAQVPAITGTPVIVTPEGLLQWPDDSPLELPNISEATSNRLSDFHGEIRDCDIAFSTAGNYHMALKELWRIYLDSYVDDLDIRNWFYTTSPPVAPDQIANGVVQVGNLNARCRPQVAVGNGEIINQLKAAGVVEGAPVKVISNWGNVILVRKGNPSRISSVWDLGRRDVTVVTPNPIEGGSFANFTGSIYNIAKADPNPPPHRTAEELFDRIFNTAPHRHGEPGSKGHGDRGDCRGRDDDHDRPKWVAGARIMHREIPWAIANHRADAAVIFYHLGLYFVRTFPDLFEIVPLGGTVDAPAPLPGNQIALLQAARIKGTWNAKQLEARERLMSALTSSEFTLILARHGLRRP